MSNAVTLVGEHLPTEVRALFDAYIEATRGANAAARAVAVAHIADRPPLKEAADQAAAAVAAAKEALAEGTRRSNRQLVDAAAGAFSAHVEDARAALAEAERQMRLAASAAAMYATAAARPGRPVLDITGDAASRSAGKQRAMASVSNIRDLLASLPEGVG